MNNQPKQVIIVAGPTAVGKTELTVRLAKYLDTHVINCDAMQIYQHMQIGSAKPSLAEQGGITHHLMDFVSPLEPYSVSDFARAARQTIAALHQLGKVPIITGGTGLYVNSLLYAMDFSGQGPDLELRHQLSQRLESEGLGALYRDLVQMAPQVAEKIHPNNRHKVLRGLEIALSGGDKGDFSKDLVRESAYEPLLLLLNRDREELYQRIDLRVEIMLQQGLIAEVQALMDLGLNESHQSMKGIGYKEVIGYLKGDMEYETLVAVLKQNSRRYAKRQLTWFRRYPEGIWINLSDLPDANAQFSAIIEEIERRKDCSGNDHPPNQQRTSQSFNN